MHPVLFHIGSVLIPSYGAVAAVGVLLALFLAQHTARVAGLDTGRVWNLCVLALFAALAGQRLLLIGLNWGVLRVHPSWLLALAMIHHPLLGAAATLAGGGAALLYARGRLPMAATADALAAPLALGLAFEQLGALLSGAGYGVEAGPAVRWAVTYTSPLAARWSGTPLGIPLHPVQAYAGLLFLALAIFLLVIQPVRQRVGDLAGFYLVGTGMILYLTERWRDPEGRGMLAGGALDGPQIAAVVLLLVGALVLMDWTALGARKSEAEHG